MTFCVLSFHLHIPQTPYLYRRLQCAIRSAARIDVIRARFLFGLLWYTRADTQHDVYNNPTRYTEHKTTGPTPYHHTKTDNPTQNGQAISNSSEHQQ